MAIIYDVSGYKNPNTLGKDVNQNANGKTLGCMIEPDYVGGMCITKILAGDSGYSPLTKAECEEIADHGYGNNKTYCNCYNCCLLIINFLEIAKHQCCVVRKF